MYDHYVELKKYIPMNIHHIRISNIEICVNVILKRVYVNIQMVQRFFSVINKFDQDPIHIFIIKFNFSKRGGGGTRPPIPN